MATAVAASKVRATAGVPIWAGRFVFGASSFALLGVAIFWDELGDPWGPGTSAALALFLFLVHLGLSFRRVSSMDPVIWVPIAILLFYFGEPVVIEWLGVPTVGGYDPWHGGNAGFLDRGFCVALLSLSCFLWGVHLAGLAHLSRGPDRHAPPDRSLGAPAVLFTLGALIMLVFGIALVGPSQVFGLYEEWQDTKLLGADERFVEAGVVFAWAGVFALLASDEAKARWRRWLAYLVFLAVLVILIQSGDRGGIVSLGVGAGWCYSQRVGRLRWTLVIAAALLVLLAFPVLAEWRAERRIDESKRSTLHQLVGESIYGMGASVNAIAYTIHFVPEQQDYEWGSSFRIAIINTVPNLGLTEGKSFGQAERKEDPSRWLVSIIAPHWAATGGGYGFAMAAEWYYNFGMPGVLFGMSLMGYLLARVRNASSRSSLALVWSATLFTGMALWVRNAVGWPLRVAVWPLVGLMIVHWLLQLLHSRRLRPRVASGDSPPRGISVDPQSSK